MDLRKNRMTIEFNDLESSSVKHIAVKSKNNKVHNLFYVWKIADVH